MNAKEAKQLTLRSINLTNLTKYVEDEISEKVHRFAENYFELPCSTLGI